MEIIKKRLKMIEQALYEGGMPKVPKEMIKPVMDWVKSVHKFGVSKTKTFRFPKGIKIYGKETGQPIEIKVILKPFQTREGSWSVYGGKLQLNSEASIEEIETTLYHELIHFMQSWDKRNIGVPKSRSVIVKGAKFKSERERGYISWLANPYEYKTFLADKINGLSKHILSLASRDQGVDVQDMIRGVVKNFMDKNENYKRLDSKTRRVFATDLTVGLNKDPRIKNLINRRKGQQDVDVDSIKKSLRSVAKRTGLDIFMPKAGKELSQGGEEKQLWIQGDNPKDVVHVFNLLRKRYGTELGLDYMVDKGKPTVRVFYDQSELRKFREMVKFLGKIDRVGKL